VRAAARRQRVLAGAGQRLARLGPGLGEEDTALAPLASVQSTISAPLTVCSAAEARRSRAVERRQDTCSHARSAAEVDSGCAASREGIAGKMWAQTLRARRRERGIRFFGSALLAAAFGMGTFGAPGSLVCPPLLAFVVLKAAASLCKWAFQPQAAASAGAGGDGKDDQMGVFMLSMVGGSCCKQAVEQLDRLCGLGASFVKLLQDALWFVFVLLVACSLMDAWAHTSPS